VVEPCGGEVERLANWSPWVTLAEATATAPRLPGVYMARLGQDGPVIYVGMAGERSGRDGQRLPKGLQGRLTVYSSGKGAVSGLGEAAFDRALADATWVRRRLEELEAGHASRAKLWARKAIEWADLQMRWAVTSDKASARQLELAILAALRTSELWNRAR
jgi:hypothetical protein